MLKQCLLALVAAGLISVAALVAAAQDNPSSDPHSSASQDSASQDPATQGNDHWRHGHLDPAQRTQELSRHLKLTSDQQTKVLDILQSERSQMESLRQDTSLSQQDRHSKMMEMHRSTHAQIRAVLDSAQQKKWDEMQARHEEQMQNRHSGQPGADSGQQQAPPSQQ